MRAILVTLALGCLLTVTSALQTQDPCKISQHMSTLLDQVISNHTDEELDTQFTKLCLTDYSGSNQAICQLIGKSMTPLLYKVASEEFSVRIGFCPSVSSEPLPSITKSNASCHTCLNLVDEIKSNLNVSKSISVIQEYGHRFCHHFFENEYKKCYDFVDNEALILLQKFERIDSSKICAAVGFCAPPEYKESTVIIPANSHQLQMSLSPKCTICDDVVTWLFKYIQTNKTEQAIEHGMNTVCGLFYHHDSIKQSQCAHMVATYLEELVHFLTIEIHPDEICALLNLCPVKSALQISFIEKPSKPSALVFSQASQPMPTCMICVQVFKYVYRRVNFNSTEKEISTALNSTCKTLFSHNSPHAYARCESIVNKNLDLIVKLVQSNAGPPLTCMALGLCMVPADHTLRIEYVDETREIPHLQNDKSYKCYFCEQLASFALKQLPPNRTEQIIKFELDKVCDRMFKGEGRSMCDDYVNKYIPLLVHYLLKYEDPALICSKLHACNNALSLPMDRVLEPYISDLLISPNDHLALDPPNCAICKLILGFVYKDLKENKTQAKIIQSLDRICERFVPGSHLDACKEYVSSYTKELIDVIENSTNPGEACNLMHYCGNDQFLPSLNDTPIIPFIIQSVTPSTEMCDDCMKYVGIVHKKVSNPQIRKNLMEHVKEFCGALPIKEKCLEVATLHINTVMDQLYKMTLPKEVCQAFRFCEVTANRDLLRNLRHKLHLFTSKKNTSDLVPKMQKPSNKHRFFSHNNTAICYDCSLLVSNFQKEMLNQTVQQKLIFYGKKTICDPLSYLEGKTCKEFFQKYGSEFINHIAQNVIEPINVCGNILKVCKYNKTVFEFEFLRPFQYTQCDRCRSVAMNLDDYLKINGNTSSSQSKLIAAACKYDKISQCSEFVNTYLSYFMQNQDQLKDYSLVCKELDMCLFLGYKHLLGGIKCTYGPSYWCYSTAHAEACNAHNYCMQNEWKTFFN